VRKMGDSIIRTVVPLIVGVILTQAARIGLDLPAGAVEEIVTVVAATVYYSAIRWLEQRYPAVGRWLLGLGIARNQPRYL